MFSLLHHWLKMFFCSLSQVYDNCLLRKIIPSTLEDPKRFEMVQRVEMQGCRPGYNEWDDGSDHDDVSKIYVRGGLTGIHYIHVDYYKSGQTVYGPIHGFSNTGFTQTV